MVESVGAVRCRGTLSQLKDKSQKNKHVGIFAQVRKVKSKHTAHVASKRKNEKALMGGQRKTSLWFPKCYTENMLGKGGVLDKEQRYERGIKSRSAHRRKHHNH